MTVVVLKAGRREPRDLAARDAALDAVCGPVRCAGDKVRREAMARRVLRYAAMALAAQIGAREAARHLDSLAGRMLAQAANERPGD
ncbi:hypothetical protein QO010_000360 [Caulobacter ginsengisoli]|uniref:Uncharacterized protein n=1 Tax=Caulobacter ginsengisoli TaxID=400775 RepID=A0ABU0IKR7_9CAUL|nr:hypothetical protein [Caulobacter ginsengisoli]MDQ0462612.1 hypothetical protein [Caulobacter ginsengisoli]